MSFGSNFENDPHGQRQTFNVAQIVIVVFYKLKGLEREVGGSTVK